MKTKGRTATFVNVRDDAVDHPVDMNTDVRRFLGAGYSALVFTPRYTSGRPTQRRMRIRPRLTFAQATGLERAFRGSWLHSVRGGSVSGVPKPRKPVTYSKFHDPAEFKKALDNPFAEPKGYPAPVGLAAQIQASIDAERAAEQKCTCYRGLNVVEINPRCPKGCKE